MFAECEGYEGLSHQLIYNGSNNIRGNLMINPLSQKRIFYGNLSEIKERAEKKIKRKNLFNLYKVIHKQNFSLFNRARFSGKSFWLFVIRNPSEDNTIIKPGENFIFGLDTEFNLPDNCISRVGFNKIERLGTVNDSHHNFMLATFSLEMVCLMSGYTLEKAYDPNFLRFIEWGESYQKRVALSRTFGCLAPLFLIIVLLVKFVF